MFSNEEPMGIATAELLRAKPPSCHQTNSVKASEKQDHNSKSDKTTDWHCRLSASCMRRFIRWVRSCGVRPPPAPAAELVYNRIHMYVCVIDSNSWALSFSRCDSNWYKLINQSLKHFVPHSYLRRRRSTAAQIYTMSHKKLHGT